MVADSKHIQPSGEPCSSPERYCHTAGAASGSSKGHSTVLSSQLLQDDEEMLGSELFDQIDRRIRHTLSSQMVVLTEALHAGKTKLHPE